MSKPVLTKHRRGFWDTGASGISMGSTWSFPRGPRSCTPTLRESAFLFLAPALRMWKPRLRGACLYFGSVRTRLLPFSVLVFSLLLPAKSQADRGTLSWLKTILSPSYAKSYRSHIEFICTHLENKVGGVSLCRSY